MWYNNYDNDYHYQLGGVEMLKQSKNRNAILSLLQSVKTHPTAEWIYTELKKDNSNISIATVYRNLNQLHEAGQIIKIDVGDGLDHYDAFTSDHCHFICKKCNSVLDIDVPSADSLQIEAEKLNGVLVQKSSLIFYGLCSNCK